MSITPQGRSVQAMYRDYRDGKLIVNRRYQRKLVWTLEEKRKLIDSILHDYPVPLVLLAELRTGPHAGKFEIIDGMQRLNAIFAFIEHGYAPICLDDHLADEVDRLPTALNDIVTMLHQRICKTGRHCAIIILQVNKLLLRRKQ